MWPKGFPRLLAPRIPETLEVTRGEYYRDGGTTCLEATDDQGKPRRLRLDQHLSSPGWLYLDNWRVPYRSVAEQQILQALTRCLESRPPLPPPSDIKPGELIKRPGGGFAVFGSADLVPSFTLEETGRTTSYIQTVIQRVQSDTYGKHRRVRRRR